MTITAAEVKRLRDMTGVGMMDCKKALTEASGDFDSAVDLLRKKGQKVAAKRADREAKEGLVTTARSDDAKTCTIAEVNCETDFVARNEEFQAFANKIAVVALKSNSRDLDSLLTTNFDGAKTVAEALVEMTGRIGEKIDVRRIATIDSSDGICVAYIHPGARLGVIVDVAGDGDAESVGRDVAMQVAALNPVAVSRDDVPESVQAKELEIGREAARADGKPDHILERIATGKLERYFKDNVLVEQPFVKDASVTVGQLLKNAGLTVRKYVRFALGD